MKNSTKPLNEAVLNDLLRAVRGLIAAADGLQIDLRDKPQHFDSDSIMWLLGFMSDQADALYPQFGDFRLPGAAQALCGAACSVGAARGLIHAANACTGMDIDQPWRDRVSALCGMVSAQLSEAERSLGEVLADDVKVAA